MAVVESAEYSILITQMIGSAEEHVVDTQRAGGHRDLVRDIIRKPHVGRSN
jgi:hypothetical protein